MTVSLMKMEEEYTQFKLTSQLVTLNFTLIDVFLQSALVELFTKN